MSLTDLIARFDVDDPTFLADPYPVLDELREATSGFRNERTGQWTITRFDGYLTLRLAAGDATRVECEGLIHRFCRHVRQVSKRQSGDAEDAELVYEVGLRDRSRDDELLRALQGVKGVSQASVLLREELSEV